MGPVTEEAYDLPMPPLAGMLLLAGENGAILARFTGFGTPICLSVPSSAYAALLNGSETVAFCSLTWNASPLCWAAVGLWWASSNGVMVERELPLIGSGWGRVREG